MEQSPSKNERRIFLFVLGVDTGQQIGGGGLDVVWWRDRGMGFVMADM
jgi:hypothetical protein